ncbi:N-acetylmuramoyl-L-alanine amidase [Kribbella monticola]|uniref:N-acetylmuramoyl-L-alanine amidase n=1 Tax=Kribbella monticola TaxID=2185285 RepID=UPI000DD3732A|nr:N-acetylmuramoyl-L-alanine amidase [Kribbella monticola]
MRTTRLAVTVLTGLALFVPNHSQALPRTGPAPEATDPSYQELPLRPGFGTTSAGATKPFGMVGITWPSRPDSSEVVVKIRVQRGGVWSDWEQLPVEDEHGPDPAGGEGQQRSGTDPIWVGDANGIDASLTTKDGTTVSDAKVVLVEPGTLATDANPPSSLAATRTDATAPYPAPAVIGRRGWGADERLRSHNGAACVRPKYTSTVQAAFVHHTADRNNYTRAQVPAMIRAMYAYHVRSRGWCDLGYNFLVDRFGRIFEGRYGGTQLPVLGAHTGAFNANSFGVSLIGNFENAKPTGSMLEATARVIAWKLDANYRSPQATVVLDGSRLHTVSGHRDTKATACPGNNLYSQLGWLKQRADVLMGRSVSTEIYRFAQQLGGYRRIGQPFWGEHPTRTGRATYFGARDLYWSPATGAHSVQGGFRGRFRTYGPDGLLGMPTAEQRNGKPAGSRAQNFHYGAIYWSPRTGMHAVNGLISRKYGALGADRSRLGLPISEPFRVAGGVQQKFQHGRLTLSFRTQKVYVT